MKVDNLNAHIQAMEFVFREKVKELSQCEFWILFELAQSDNCKVLELAKRRGRSFQTISRVSYNLQERGLLTIEMDNEDARARRVNLTGKGRKLYRKAANAISRNTKDLELEAA